MLTFVRYHTRWAKSMSGRKAPLSPGTRMPFQIGFAGRSGIGAAVSRGACSSWRAICQTPPSFSAVCAWCSADLAGNWKTFCSASRSTSSRHSWPGWNLPLGTNCPSVMQIASRAKRIRSGSPFSFFEGSTRNAILCSPAVRFASPRFSHPASQKKPSS